MTTPIEAQAPRTEIGRSRSWSVAAPLAAGLAAAVIAGGTAVAEGPVVTEFTLENGLQGVVIEDHRAPVVTHMVWYRVGSADEPRGKSGIAHYLEHLMFKGTDTLAPGEFSKIVAANGGQDNAFTSLDYTAYFQRVAKDRLGLMMSIEADRMVNLEFTEEEAITERAVVIEERNSRTDNDPQNQFFEDYRASLYLNHPYGAPVIGWRHEIETLTRQDALDFYEDFYGPDNAILVVAGDVDPAEVEALAQEHYGAIPARGVGAQPRPTEPPHRAARRLRLADPRIRQDYVTRAYLAPSYVTGGVETGAAMLLFAEILGGGKTSRIQDALVRGEKIALSAGAYYSGLTRDDSSFSFYGAPVDGVELETLEAALEREFVRLRDEGPTEEELNRAKNVLEADRIYRRDSLSGMARQYGSALTVGLTVADIDAWPQIMAAVTAEDVQAAARLLRLEASVTGWLETADAGAGQTQ